MGKIAGRTKGGPLAGRLGVKGGGGGVTDARQKIIQVVEKARKERLDNRKSTLDK